MAFLATRWRDRYSNRLSNYACKEIGIVNTIRFVNQFTVGYGNYTEEREALFEDLTMDDIVASIKHKQVQSTDK